MKCFFLFLFLCFNFLVSAQSKDDFYYRTGDLVFQDLDCGELCDAIEAVTKAVDGKHFSHIGLVYVKTDSILVIEAIGAAVHTTPINVFLARYKDSLGNSKVVVGRVKDEYHALCSEAVQFALEHIGTPYDEAFVNGDKKYYCSELVYESYKMANEQTGFFQLNPMTFKDPNTHKTFAAWKRYFRALHIPVPEGKLGCNPGGISLDEKIQIVKRYY